MSDVHQILSGVSANNIFNLKDVVAVVTGGSTGIGLMISTTLMANGATVYMVNLDQAQLDKIADTYNKGRENHPERGRLVGIQCDVSIKKEVERLAAEIAKREKHVTVLFNNAGVQGQRSIPPKEKTAAAYHKVYWEIDPKSFDDTLRVNSVAPYYVSVAFLPLLEKWKESEGGQRFPPQIIMTSSMNGWTKDPATAGFSFPYLMSKSAIGHFTSTLAHDLLPLGIRVNGIAPGLFATDMSAPGTMNEYGHSTVDLKRFSFASPAQSHGTHRDMGTLILMLVANCYITGETVLIDGGILLHHPSSY